MSKYISWSNLEIPDIVNKLLLQNERKIVVVGVIGKSAFPDCNKLAALNILDEKASLIEHEPNEGQIQFYYNPADPVLWLHFETTYDAYCMQKILTMELKEQKFDDMLTFHQRMRNRFARTFLFATHVCHLIVFVELSVTFDVSMLAIFKSLRIIRDRHVLKFLPKFIKNSRSGYILGKSARLCSSRVIFVFENLPKGHEKTYDSISKLEFEVEDNIYKMLRNEHIVMNNNSASLFSIPVNQRFVYYNLNDKIREDPLLKSVQMLEEILEKPNFLSDEELDDLLPYKDFGKPSATIKCTDDSNGDGKNFAKNRTFTAFLKEHIEQALDTGFNDNLCKYKGKSHFVILTAKNWLEIFKFLHKVFIENPDNEQFEANDADYKAYLENFDVILNYDREFFNACCNIGLQKAFSMYSNPSLKYYSAEVHRNMLEEAVKLYHKYARGPQKSENELALRRMCEDCWKSGKQQCEYPSLRGHPCALPKHTAKDITEHSSGIVFLSTCNCGRTQGRREDPYSILHANYEFYEYMATNCILCAKVKRIQFAVFQPSSNDYRAAQLDWKHELNRRDNDSVAVSDKFASNHNDSDLDSYLVSQESHTNLSLSLSPDNLNKISVADNINNNMNNSSEDESLKELILKVKDRNASQDIDVHNVIRQPSTTEYLPGMVHTESPMGFLPRFPSWSLCCVGASSIYSHRSGLMEHFQCGFLAGSNFLLPWDVHVRLEHSATWAAYEKARYRKMGEAFVLKIFVGFEYECPRGHRFMMSAPDKVLRGGSEILRDSGSKVVYNNMPLYFPCPCRTKKFDIAQLMRIHVVTPKAPVDVMLDPRVRTGQQSLIFILGLPEPPKLTQSAYWILRLPYIYEDNDGPIPPPKEVTAVNALDYGCILAGMFGVSETELDD